MDLPWRKVEIWRFPEHPDVSKLAQKIMISEGESTYFKWHLSADLTGSRGKSKCDVLRPGWHQLRALWDLEGFPPKKLSHCIGTNHHRPSWCLVWNIIQEMGPPKSQTIPNIIWPKLFPIGFTEWIFIWFSFVFDQLRRKKAKSDTEEGVPANETYEAPAGSCVEGYRSWQSNIALRKCGSRD